MHIKLEKLMPHPLSSIPHNENSIWGKTTQLSPKQKILLNASSGKGKSTFLTTILGVRKDYDGTILFDDIDIRNLTLEEWSTIRATKLAAVFQDLQLFPKLSVKENLLLKNELTHKKTEGEFLSELKKVGMEDKWDQKCGLLSMGQQQRVAIIRALSQPFEWLFLDEPFSHLDDENTQICLNMIVEETKKESAGFILTTLGDRHNFQFDLELNL